MQSSFSPSLRPGAFASSRYLLASSLIGSTKRRKELNAMAPGRKDAKKKEF
jgi:hypothetical protein